MRRALRRITTPRIATPLRLDTVLRARVPLRVHEWTLVDAVVVAHIDPPFSTTTTTTALATSNSSYSLVISRMCDGRGIGSRQVVCGVCGWIPMRRNVHHSLIPQSSMSMNVSMSLCLLCARSWGGCDRDHG